ncbi:hypothetical protein ACLOJK_032583 [Asimina triloba]
MAASILLSTIAVASAAVSRIDLGPTAQILATCKLTNYPAVCVETSKPMETTGPVTVQRVARMSIEAAIERAGKAKESAAAMMNADHGGKMRHADFQLCQQEYVDGINALRASIKELEAGVHDMLMDNLSAAMTSYTTCDDAFAEATEVSPLAADNAMLAKITSNSLALAQNVPKPR